MEMEYVGKILDNGNLSISPDIRKKFSVGEKVKIRLRKKISKKTKGLSLQAQELIRLFEKASDRGGYCGHEVTREFIHEREDIF